MKGGAFACKWQGRHTRVTLGSAGGTACGREGSRSRPRGRSADRRARALCGVLTGSSRPPACLSSIKLTRLSSRLLNPSPGGDRHGPDCLPKGWTKTSLSVSKRLGGRNANAQTEPLGRSCRPLWRPSLAQEWLGQGWSPRPRVLRGFGKCYPASQRLTGSSGQPRRALHRASAGRGHPQVREPPRQEAGGPPRGRCRGQLPGAQFTDIAAAVPVPRW